MLPPVFKTGEGREKRPWRVRFPCASAIFFFSYNKLDPSTGFIAALLPHNRVAGEAIASRRFCV